MNVLLITYSFPPAAGVGVLRALSLAKYLPESGIHVDVLTARNAAAVGRDASLLNGLSSDVTITRTLTLDLPFALRKAIKKLVTRSSVGQRNPSAGRSKPSLIKRIVGNLLLPDPQVGWLPFVLPAARRIIRKGKIDLVLITVPPFSTAMLVKRLRKLYPDLPIVLDFRDEWLTSTINLVSFNSNQRAQRVARKTEAEAVNAASAIVCVTEAAQKELRLRYPDLPTDHFHCIPNGYDTSTINSLFDASQLATNDSRRIVITYIGTIYKSTDPTTLVAAILLLPQATRDRLHFRFIGHIETKPYRDALLSLGDSVELVGFLPQAEALRSIETTDYLLLITHDPINVAAKFYDYLGSGRPILGVVHHSGEVKTLLDQTRSGCTADSSDPLDIARLLSEAVGRLGDVSLSKPDAEKIASYHRKPLTARYASLLRTIAGDAPC